jgi:hypothetical protein
MRREIYSTYVANHIFSATQARCNSRTMSCTFNYDGSNTANWMAVSLTLIEQLAIKYGGGAGISF